jgi:hypothetical protein
MKLIESKTLGTAAAAIEFTSIPQTFTDLVILHSLRSQDAESNGNISFNGSTSDFTSRFLRGFISSVDSGTATRYMFSLGYSSLTADSFSNGTIYIPNYTSAAFKSISSDSVMDTNNGQSTQRLLVAGLWSNTAAITSLSLSANTGNMIAGSTVSLYGITKGSSGGVVVS